MAALAAIKASKSGTSSDFTTPRAPGTQAYSVEDAMKWRLDSRRCSGRHYRKYGDS